ncbi:hypothetical protein D3C72_1750100 [compost metagenome]
MTSLPTIDRLPDPATPFSPSATMDTFPPAMMDDPNAVSCVRLVSLTDLLELRLIWIWALAASFCAVVA